jgi:Fe-S cluster biogenesis protein NfuA
MQPVTVQIEATPNPRSLKFVTNIRFLETGGRDFPAREAARQGSPLAAKLFDLPGVDGVYIGTHFVTVSKTDAVDWQAASQDVIKTLLDHLGVGLPVFGESAHAAHDAAEGDVAQRIQDVLDEYVRPAVAQDGGDVIFRGYVEGIVKLQLQGSCNGCPSSTMTLKMGIENMLKEQIPEVQGVEQVSY